MAKKSTIILMFIFARISHADEDSEKRNVTYL